MDKKLNDIKIDEIDLQKVYAEQTYIKHKNEMDLFIIENIKLKANKKRKLQLPFLDNTLYWKKIGL